MNKNKKKKRKLYENKRRKINALRDFTYNTFVSLLAKVEIGICFFFYISTADAAAVDVGEKQDLIMDFVALMCAGGNRPGQDK